MAASGPAKPESLDTEAPEQVELLVGGMTCASCAGRIERRLNKMEGVTASVNLPLERATVTVPPGVTPEQLIAEVEKAGYTARVPEPPQAEGATPDEPVDDEAAKAAGLRQRFVFSAALAIPVVLLSMVPALQFDNWLAFTLAGPVVLWGGWPFHVAAVRNLRHGTASMDTLISVGTLAAYGWSIWGLFVGSAGDPGMRMGWHLFGSVGSDEIYLEAAAGVVAFIQAGRFLEARAKRRAGAALRSLLELGAKDAAVLRDGREERIPADQLQVGDRFVVRPGEKVATDGVVEDGSSAIDASLLTGESVPVEVGPGASVTGATINVGGPGHPDRGRHHARPDQSARQRRPDRKGPGPTPGRPHLRGVRTRGHRPGHRHPRGLARRRGLGARRVHRGGGRADHRLPVRHGPGHPHRPPGGHRPGRPARHPHQGS